MLDRLAKAPRNAGLEVRPIGPEDDPEAPQRDPYIVQRFLVIALHEVDGGLHGLVQDSSDDGPDGGDHRGGRAWVHGHP